MKNLLKNKKLKFNSKKGFTLIELIVAVMILLVVISASVRGVSISYRSALLGAEKNDAQSLAQRNCDIIMSAIVTNVENRAFTNEYTLDGMVRFDGDGFVNNGSNTYLDWVCDDTDIILENNIGYDKDQYAEIKQVVGGVEEVKAKKSDDVLDAKTSLQPIKKYQYFTLSRTEKKISDSTYQVYKITTYVYYSDNGFVTCEGEVSVMPET